MALEKVTLRVVEQSHVNLSVSLSLSLSLSLILFRSMHKPEMHNKANKITSSLDNI